MASNLTNKALVEGVSGPWLALSTRGPRACSSFTRCGSQGVKGPEATAMRLEMRTRRAVLVPYYGVGAVSASDLALGAFDM